MSLSINKFHVLCFSEKTYFFGYFTPNRKHVGESGGYIGGAGATEVSSRHRGQHPLLLWLHTGQDTNQMSL